MDPVVLLLFVISLAFAALCRHLGWRMRGPNPFAWKAQASFLVSLLLILPFLGGVLVAQSRAPDRLRALGVEPHPEVRHVVGWAMGIGARPSGCSVRTGSRGRSWTTTCIPLPVRAGSSSPIRPGSNSSWKGRRCGSGSRRGRTGGGVPPSPTTTFREGGTKLYSAPSRKYANCLTGPAVPSNLLRLRTRCPMMPIPISPLKSSASWTSWSEIRAGERSSHRLSGRVPPPRVRL
jgi:hypothetical protein